MMKVKSRRNHVAIMVLFVNAKLGEHEVKVQELSLQRFLVRDGSRAPFLGAPAFRLELLLHVGSEFQSCDTPTAP